jgi:hypothetical protein
VQISTEVEEINVNPVLNFFFALKAPESKRQYPKRFEKFLDYLKLEGSFEDKSLVTQEKIEYYLSIIEEESTKRNLKI